MSGRQSRKRVVVVSNDVFPGMGGAVAAPGLRAHGLAAGLRAHGVDVTLVVVDSVTRKAWTRSTPPPQPRGTARIPHELLGDYVRSQRPDAVVLTNSNYFQALGDLGDTALVYDFFAPKMLELAEHVGPEDRDEVLGGLRARKLEALAASSAVIINGRKKVPYVEQWLADAGNASVPHAVVPMPVPPLDLPEASDRPDGPPRFVVAGYLQPWSRPGPWVDVLTPMLDAGEATLELLLASHWGGRRGDEVPETMAHLLTLPNVTTHGSMEFDDFRAMLATCDVSIDLFARNPERELAFVTRTAVAISCGLPVLHVPFTEVSELVAEHDAGWLVDESDDRALTSALEEVVASPDVVARKRAGARRLAESLAPAEVVKPLVTMLEEM